MDLKFRHGEFEEAVRNRLSVFDRPVTETDAERVTELELSNFDFLPEDYETLFYFKNLTSLDINIGETTPDFWAHFPQMRELWIVCWGKQVDFESFRAMKNLEHLWVSGGDISNIPYVNTEALPDLPKLSSLGLHEFGSVDVQPLSRMKQLKSFELLYSNEVKNIEAIGKMTFLEELHLHDIAVDDLDFLDTLPDTLKIELSTVYVRENMDVTKLQRFTDRNIEGVGRDVGWHTGADLSRFKKE